MSDNELAATVAQLIATNGGATVNPARGNLAGQPFYAVAVYPDRETIFAGPPTAADVRAFIAHNRDLLADPANSVGAWTADGRTYLDVSRTVPNRSEALALAAQHNQLAIYDLGTGREIPVPREREAA